MMKKFSVIVPETVPHWRNFAGDIAYTLADIFGGYNLYFGKGGWSDGGGSLIIEEHARVESYGDWRLLTSGERELLYAALSSLINDGKQSAVFVDYDGTGYLLESCEDVYKFVSGGSLRAELRGDAV